MKLSKLSAIGAAALLVVAACEAAPPVQPGDPTPPTGPVQDPLGVIVIPEGDPIHVAFWGVLSGADSVLGEDQYRGVVLALEDLDPPNELLGRRVRLSAQDALCTPEGGSIAATAMVADRTIVAAIGSSCSAETAGGIARLHEAGYTTISGSNTRPAFTDPAQRGPEMAGYLRTAHSDAVQGEVAARFAREHLGIERAAVIHMSEAYSEALVGVFADNFEALGGTVVAREATARGETDMRPMLTRVAAESPEFIFYPLFTAEAGFVTAQVRDVPGLEDVILMGADAGFSAEMIEAAGPNSAGMYLSSPNFEAFGGDYDGFLEKHRAKYGGPPIQIFHAHAYDAVNILFAAIRQVAVEEGGTIYIGRQALRDAIFATQNFQGVTGTLSCNEHGDCSAPVIAVYQISDELAANPRGPAWPPSPMWP